MADIEFSTDRHIARVLLNRPTALNALTHDMCLALDQRLIAWARDPAVKAVVVEGAGGKAFCAGGDIRKLYEGGKAKDGYPQRFWHDEYVMNARIKHFPKPYIAVLDGITMGGGVGLSVHGSHRVITEHVLFAMPETGIGLFPDVGGTYFLPRCPGQLGLFLGLTGTRLKSADTFYCGVGTHHVPRERIAAMVDALASSGDVEGTLKAFHTDPGPAPLAPHRATIDRAFAEASVGKILAALESEDGEWGPAVASIIRTKSPTSVKLTFQQIRRGAKAEFDACMNIEWCLVNSIINGHDFYEGVRAVIIDKDQKPVWKPAQLEEVSDSEIEAYFRTPASGGLKLD